LLMMEHRFLGKEGPGVSVIGFGAWQLNNPMWGGPDREASVRLVQAALRFIISHPEISTVIPGVKSEAQLKANLAAVEAGPLSPDLVSAIQQFWESEIADNPPPW
jgi:aryl-alcohol dehydrogenase-like predicted oxidoreductase